MNLLRERWIPVRLASGRLTNIAPAGITDVDDPPQDIAAARPDFKGALAQFLVALLQTSCAPEDGVEWEELWCEPPSAASLDEAFGCYSEAFEFGAQAPSFMEDYALPEAEPKPIASLLIEAPGGKTVKDNLDLFVKRGIVECMCPACAATALFTLQTNAPSGGVGHRTSLRGGGPLTTLVIPDEAKGPATLWQRLWLNVLSKEAIAPESARYASSDGLQAVFPWLGPTRTSEAKTGQDTYPENGHFLQNYWAMPRRVRLEHENAKMGTCDVCGAESDQTLSGYRTKNYGINYQGPWVHPLSPYAIDAKQSSPPLPLHGQKGGLTYRYWLSAVLGDAEGTRQPAAVVRQYLDDLSFRIAEGGTARLWVFGYDMDNMKARCWYEGTMPVYHLSADIRAAVRDGVAKMVEVAREAVANTRHAVKQAWFERPKDVKGDTGFIDAAFWDSTESEFFKHVSRLIGVFGRQEDAGLVYRDWHLALVRAGERLFDQWAASGPVEDMDMKRLVRARKDLLTWLWRGRAAKALLASAA